MRLEKTITILIAVAIISCNKNNQIDQNCSYIKYQGKAKIITVADAPANENNCILNPQKVTFVFMPNDTSVRNNYIFKSWSDTSALKISGGTNPSQSFLDSLDITIGKEYNCNRQEIIKGSCIPVWFEFTTIDLNPINGCR
jgi:hypothetical protein